VNLQQKQLAKPHLPAIPEGSPAGQLPKGTRSFSKIGPPVAFIRMLYEPAFFVRAAPWVHWIVGSEKIAGRSNRSCCSCPPSPALVNQSRGAIGFAAAPARLDLIAAFRPDHRGTCLRDALAGHGLDDPPADESTTPFQRHSYLVESHMKRPTGSHRHRKLGNGKNSGG
jgi:hypothetical protein